MKLSSRYSAASLIPTDPAASVERFTRYSDLTDMALRCGVLRASKLRPARLCHRRICFGENDASLKVMPI